MKKISNYKKVFKWALEKPNKWNKKGLDCSCESYCKSHTFIPNSEFIIKYKLSKNEVLQSKDVKIRKIEEIELPEYLEGEIIINISSFRRDGGYQEFPVSVSIVDVEEMKIKKLRYERKEKLDNLKNLFKDE